DGQQCRGAIGTEGHQLGRRGTRYKSHLPATPRAKAGQFVRPSFQLARYQAVAKPNLGRPTSLRTDSPVLVARPRSRSSSNRAHPPRGERAGWHLRAKVLGRWWDRTSALSTRLA